MKDTKNSQAELLYAQQLACGESPLYDFQKQVLYWVDSARPGIYCFNFRTHEPDFIPTPVDVTFVALKQGGGLILGSSSGVYVLTPNGEVQKRPYPSTQELVRLNDAVVDPKGRIFTGQEAFSDDEPDRKGYLFRLSPDGRADVVEEGLSIANGMGFSPDRRTFYLIDTIDRVLYAYDYGIESGNIKNRRVLKKFDADEGLPDGMTVDEEGYLWVALWFGSAIVRIDPEGKQLAKFFLPFSQPTSVCFGGPDFSSLYITSAAHLWKTPLAPKNHDYTAARGGSVYRMDTVFKGLPEHLAKIE